MDFVVFPLEQMFYPVTLGMVKLNFRAFKEEEITVFSNVYFLRFYHLEILL